MIDFYIFSIGTTLIISSGIAIPYLYESYKDDFDTGAWRPWVKLFLFMVTFISGITTGLYSWINLKTLSIAATSLLAITTLWDLYYIIFGLSLASLELVKDLSNASMLSDKLTCFSLSSPETYQSFLYISSLFFILTSTALGIDFFARKLLRFNLVNAEVKIAEGESRVVNESKVHPMDKTDSDNFAILPIGQHNEIAQNEELFSRVAPDKNESLFHNISTGQVKDEQKAEEFFKRGVEKNTGDSSENSPTLSPGRGRGRGSRGRGRGRGG